jgi:molybdopterin molybdotransferase
MISFQEAQELVLRQARSFGLEEVELGAAFGRVLSETVKADRDYPPFARATMDGYALRQEDLVSGVCRFRVTETVFAGTISLHRIGQGECYKIMTGAAVPEDADLVIRREDVEEGGEVMELRHGAIEVGPGERGSWKRGLHIARRGEDLRAGEVVFDKACRCGPATMGLLATLGRATVNVACLPRVGLVTTGNEVVEPGTFVNPVQIRNSNRYMLLGGFRGEGIQSVETRHASDHPGELEVCLRDLLTSDILVVTGGVSAGDADHVPRVLGELGVRRLFHKIAMKPGKPTWCGVLPGGGLVFALPGNPFSCLVNFVLLIAPYLRACMGLERELPMSLPLREGRAKRTPLDEFFPVRVWGRPAMLHPLRLNSSGDVRLGMMANALALHPAGDADLEAGHEVLYYSLP